MEGVANKSIQKTTYREWLAGICLAKLVGEHTMEDAAALAFVQANMLCDLLDNHEAGVVGTDDIAEAYTGGEWKPGMPVEDDRPEDTGGFGIIDLDSM